MGFWDAYESSRQATQGILMQHRVGGALANGDFKTAATEAYRLGNPQLAGQIEAQAMQREQLARRAQLGGLIADGQGRQAADTALRAGDFESAQGVQSYVSSLDAQQRAAAQQRTEAMARAAVTLRGLPQEQRAGAAAQLAEQIGVEVPQGFDFSDTALDGVINQARSLEQLLKPAEGFTLGDGQVRFDAQGNEIARGPQTPKYVAVPEGGRLERVDAGRGAGVASGAAPAMSGVRPEAVIARTLGEGFRVTSGARSEADNRRVGGAPNSYHLRDQARDIIPPPGMSMAEAAAALKATGQFVEVINEGDHVHVAWGTQTGAGVRAGMPDTFVGAPKRDKDAQTPRQEREAAMKLRKEFNALPGVKDYREVEANYRQVRSLARPDATAADDVALIFSYMKMLDPGSVVREGEFATAQNTAGIPDQVRNAYNKAISGNRLNASQRQQFADTAERVYEQRRERYGQLVEEYRGYAADTGIDADSIARPMTQGDATPRDPNRASGKRWTAAQQATLDRSAKTGPRGSEGNPFVIDPAQADESYRSIPRGSLYISPDGQIRRKS